MTTIYQESKPTLTVVENDVINIQFVNDAPTVFNLLEDSQANTKLFSLLEKGQPGINAYQLAQRNGFTGTEAEWLNSLKEVENSRYDFSIFLQNSIYSEEDLWNFSSVTPFKFILNFEGSIAKAKTPPLQEFNLFVLKNDVQFGRIIFSPDSLYARFDSIEQTFKLGDILSIVSDSVVDPNLTNVSITLAAYRGL